VEQWEKEEGMETNFLKNIIQFKIYKEMKKMDTHLLTPSKQ
jgi:hypothetical protein